MPRPASLTRESTRLDPFHTSSIARTVAASSRSRPSNVMFFQTDRARALFPGGEGLDREIPRMASSGPAS